MNDYLCQDTNQKEITTMCLHARMNAGASYVTKPNIRRTGVRVDAHPCIRVGREAFETLFVNKLPPELSSLLAGPILAATDGEAFKCSIAASDDPAELLYAAIDDLIPGHKDLDIRELAERLEETRVTYGVYQLLEIVRDGQTVIGESIIDYEGAENLFLVNHQPLLDGHPGVSLVVVRWGEAGSRSGLLIEWEPLQGAIGRQCKKGDTLFLKGVIPLVHLRRASG